MWNDKTEFIFGFNTRNYTVTRKKQENMYTQSPMRIRDAIISSIFIIIIIIIIIKAVNPRNIKGKKEGGYI